LQQTGNKTRYHNWQQNWKQKELRL